VASRWGRWIANGVLAGALGFLAIGSGTKFYDETLGRKSARTEYGHLSPEEAVKAISTPEEARRYCTRYIEYTDDELQDRSPDFWAPFALTHARQRGDCEDAAFSALELLADDGYPPWLLIMTGPGDGHAIYLYQRNGKFGTLGSNRTDCRTAAYASLADIVREYGEYDAYEVLDASRVPRHQPRNLKMAPGYRTLAQGTVERSTLRALWAALADPFR
jgi:hypothetical protein